MPETRSARKKKQPEDDEREKETDDDDDSVEEQQDSSEKTANTFRRNSREMQRQRREEIKSRNTGVGLSISTKATGKKIVFEDNGFSDEKVDDEQDAADAETGKAHDAEEGSDNDSDEDDAIEEVKSSIACDKAMEQLAKERETSKVQKLQSRSKKRKAKTAAATDKEEEEDFDETFFEKVDSAMAEQQKQKKIAKESVPAGRHTTFLSTEEEMNSCPIQTDHNIELVVLGDTDKGPVSSAVLQNTEDKAGMEPSEASHLFARGRLASGKDQAKRKGTKKKKQNDIGWKQSKKMNVLASGRKVRQRKGCAAANFVLKS